VSAESLYLVFNYGVLPAWALLLFAPRWHWTQRIVHSILIPGILGAAYILLLFKESFPEGAGGSSLKAAMLVFTEPWLFLVCWIHYLVLDLFIGAWEVRDARRLAIPHLAVAPCLVLTNLFAPAGLLLYLLVRAFMRRTVTLEEA